MALYISGKKSRRLEPLQRCKIVSNWLGQFLSGCLFEFRAPNPNEHRASCFLRLYPNIDSDFSIFCLSLLLLQNTDALHRFFMVSRWSPYFIRRILALQGASHRPVLKTNLVLFFFFKDNLKESLSVHPKLSVQWELRAHETNEPPFFHHLTSPFTRG